MEICLVTGLKPDMQSNIEVAGLPRHYLIRTHIIMSRQGTFSSSHVYPQSGACERTRVTRAGVFSVGAAGCSDTLALISRRYDLDPDTTLT